jgi:hypothetical protein
MNMITTVKGIPSVDQVEATFVTDTSFPVGKDFKYLFPNEKSES